MPPLVQFPFASSVLAFVFGTIFGSFGSVLLARIPAGRWIGGRSRCGRCKTQLRAMDLIPLLSFAFLRGRCRRCRTRISRLYPALELASGFLFVLALTSRGFVFLPSLLLALALWLLFLNAVMDARTGFVSDYLTFPFVALSILLALLAPPFPLLAPAIGAGFFAVQWLLSRGRWVGSGDILVGAGMGFLLRDARLVIVALFLAYVTGAAVALTLMLVRRKTVKDRLAFVPFLFLGTLASLLCGYMLIGWYGL